MRSALSLSIAAALLSACGGGSSPLVPRPGLVNNGVIPLLKSRTFHFTGAEQNFKVPNGVTSITIVARGAQGGGNKGGRGGRVYAVIPVRSRAKLYVFVGGQGIRQYGGFNGGGEGGALYGYAFGGGGATDIRSGGKEARDRIIVAGGGGGEGEVADPNAASQSHFYVPYGGKGGGSTGEAGQTGWPGKYSGGGGGAGGSQDQGGHGGYGGSGRLGDGRPGKNGTFRFGGDGGAGCYYSRSCFDGRNGAGGGGGYYGGGGGGNGGADSSFSFGGGGGGGGSSYIEPKASKFQEWRGWKNALGDGLVVISWK